MYCIKRLIYLRGYMFGSLEEGYLVGITDTPACRGEVVPFTDLCAEDLKRMLINPQHIGQFMGIALTEETVDEVRCLHYVLPEASDEVGRRRVVEGAHKYVEFLSSLFPGDQSVVLRTEAPLSKAAISFVLTSAVQPKYIDWTGDMVAISKMARSLSDQERLDVLSLYGISVGFSRPYGNHSAMPQPARPDAKGLLQVVLDLGAWPRQTSGHIPLARLHF